MLSEIKSLISQGQITKNDLLNVIQKNARIMSLADFKQFNLTLRQDAKALHSDYSADFIKSYTNFMLRIRDVKDDKLNYVGLVEIDKLNDAVDLLLEQEKDNRFNSGEIVFRRVYRILSLYSTFIKGESIHQVGFTFPGGLKVKKKGDIFICPVKNNGQDNPMAVCPICISEPGKHV